MKQQTERFTPAALTLSVVTAALADGIPQGVPVRRALWLCAVSAVCLCILSALAVAMLQNKAPSFAVRLALTAGLFMELMHTLSLIHISMPGTETVTTEQVENLLDSLNENYPDNQFAQLSLSNVSAAMGTKFLQKSLVAVVFAPVSYTHLAWTRWSTTLLSVWSSRVCVWRTT